MPAVYYTPSGPANLTAMFPAVNFNDVEEYFVEVLDVGSSVIATTPLYKMENCDDDVIVSFINYLGQLDSIGFSAAIEHDTKSETFQKPASYPLQRVLPGNVRLNIKSNDNYTLTTVLEEEQMQWFDELLDSPLSWIQVRSNQGLIPGYIPIVITDQTSVKRKDEERFSYEVTVKATLSNERIIISN